MKNLFSTLLLLSCLAVCAAGQYVATSATLHVPSVKNGREFSNINTAMMRDVAIGAEKFKILVMIVVLESVLVVKLKNLRPFIESASGARLRPGQSKFSPRTPSALSESLFFLGRISAFVGAHPCSFESGVAGKVVSAAFRTGGVELTPSEIHSLAGIGAKSRLFRGA